MSELARLQGRFLDALLSGAGEAESDLPDATRRERRRRLDIYRDAYRQRLYEALQEAYPALHTLLGDERFAALVRDYLAAHPSRHYSIRWFGDRLSGFLRGHDEYRALPVAAEMAEFEWALRDVFDAADAEPLTLASLRALPSAAWVGLRLCFIPALRLLDLHWNVPRLWHAIEADAAPIEALAGSHPVSWLLWRAQLQSHYRSLAADEAWALRSMLGGESFGTVCEGLTEWVDPVHAAPRAATLLCGWVDAGLVSGVSVDAA